MGPKVSTPANLPHHRRQLGFTLTGHLQTDGVFIALLRRLVKHLALQAVGQILLFNPMVAVGMGIEIALAVAKFFFISVGVPQRVGHLCFSFFFHGGQGIKKAHDAVGFGAGGQVQRRLG